MKRKIDREELLVARGMSLMLMKLNNRVKQLTEAPEGKSLRGKFDKYFDGKGNIVIEKVCGDNDLTADEVFSLASIATSKALYDQARADYYEDVDGDMLDALIEDADKDREYTVVACESDTIEGLKKDIEKKLKSSRIPSKVKKMIREAIKELE